MKKRSLGIYSMFVIAVAALLTTAFILCAVSVFLLYFFGLIGPEFHPNPMYFFVIIALPSLIIGIVLAALFGHRATRPVSLLSEGMKRIAEGDFDLRLDETRKDEFGQLNHNFNIMSEKLSEIEILGNDFIDNVSHEFKTPLSAMQGYATLLQDVDCTEEERKEYLAAIIDAVRVLSSLSSNILELSKLEAQSIDLNTTRFSLDEQMRQIILMFEPLWEEKRLAINASLEKVDIQGNEEMLITVWSNLLSNAIKFSEEGGQISVRIYQDQNRAVIEISNTGGGIEPKAVPRVFDKFYQADTSRQDKGNGLGLALVKKIVDLHGGEVKARSEFGVEATFIVLLPLD